ICGPGADFIINCTLFLCSVIPSHVHAFCISCTYFHRKRGVRKNRYPGGRKIFIYSERVWNGGASWERVKELKMKESSGDDGVVEVKEKRPSNSRNNRDS
ncbi:hypothetical protein B0J14DRAFT_476340, partial [Halenospora varia]